jgi:hypothetical protein
VGAVTTPDTGKLIYVYALLSPHTTKFGFKTRSIARIAEKAA